MEHEEYTATSKCKAMRMAIWMLCPIMQNLRR
jgi:hypothetical protein